MPQFTAADIRRYYDRNTAAFIALGEGGNVGAIHRAVWGPGVRGLDEAFRYVEDQIIQWIRRLCPNDESCHVVDLGCGVAGSLCYLAERLPNLTGRGVTLSAVQARLATERIDRAGFSGRLLCVEGDYNDLSSAIRRSADTVRLTPAVAYGRTDVAYAIESFVHAPDPRRFLSECHRLIRPGGLLIVCDDFLRNADDPAAAPAIEQFRRGWHVNTLIASGELLALAGDAGFTHESTVDLSSYLELNRPRDRAIEVLVAAIGWLPGHWSRADHLVGGSALQRCLSRGWIGYDLAVFRRRDA